MMPKSPAGLPTRRLEPHPELLAWAAGLFEAEGNTHAHKSHGRFWYPALKVAQSGEAASAPDVLVRFRSALGGMGFIEGPFFPGPPHRPKWGYAARGYEIVQAIVAMLWDSLGPVKRAQAARVLLAYRAVPAVQRKNGVRFGRSLRQRGPAEELESAEAVVP
jgi:hypothetical protein